MKNSKDILADGRQQITVFLLMLWYFVLAVRWGGAVHRTELPEPYLSSTKPHWEYVTVDRGAVLHWAHGTIAQNPIGFGLSICIAVLFGCKLIELAFSRGLASQSSLSIRERLRVILPGWLGLFLVLAVPMGGSFWMPFIPILVWGGYVAIRRLVGSGLSRTVASGGSEADEE